MLARRSGLIAGVALALLLSVWASGTGIGIAHAQSGSSYVRVMQAAPANATVDVYLDGGSKPLLSNFAFGTATGYTPWSVGQHTVVITPAGKPVSAAIATASVTTADGASYTLATVGDSKTKPGVFLFTDDNSIKSGMGKLRFYHISVDAGPAALTMSLNVGGKTNLPNTGFEQASNYFKLKPGSYTFYVTLVGGAKTAPQPLTLQANKVTSIFGVGEVNGKGDSAFRFVIATADATPTKMPPTGYGPHSTAAQSESASMMPYLGFGVLALLAGALLPVWRRARARRRAYAG